MIYPKDLQIGSVIAMYMTHAGYASTLATDSLNFAHILRRSLESVQIFNAVQRASHLLDAIFVLGMRPNQVLSPSDLRLYIRVFITSRLPPVLGVWNKTLATRFLAASDEPYDVVNAEPARMNETYVYFSNCEGHAEHTYVATPEDVLKMMIFRRTPEVRTFMNSEALLLHRVVYVDTPDPHCIEESNAYPIKVYTVDELDEQSEALLCGKMTVRSF